MNENHVIDSWVAELALGARTSRARRPHAARRAEADVASIARVTELAPAAWPVSRRITALLDRPRSGAAAAMRPCFQG
jgi:hypothetical protein